MPLVPPRHPGATHDTCTPPPTLLAATALGAPGAAAARVAGQTAAARSISPLPKRSSRPAVPRSTALASSLASTSSGVLPGYRLRTTAAAAATYGVAIDVPDMVA